MTSSASSAASRANTASLSGAFVASARLLASRAAASFSSRDAAAADAAASSEAVQHAAHRCFPGPLLLSCAREKADAGLDSPHAAHACEAVGSASPGRAPAFASEGSDAARCFAVSAASARSLAAAAAGPFLHRTIARVPALLRLHVRAESTAGRRLRSQAPAQSNAPCHRAGPSRIEPRGPT